jgi:hypothetical protein
MNKIKVWFALTLAAQMDANANSNILLQVDISDFSSVKITALPGFSAISVNANTFEQGVTLVNLLQGVPAISGPVSMIGDLTVNGSEPLGFDKIEALDLNAVDMPGNDVNLWMSNTNPGQFNIMNFVSGQTAFTGQLTFDASLFASFSPGVGYVGDIVSGDDNGFSSPIGTYVVIPEPKTYSIGFGLVGLLVAIIKRKRSLTKQANV